MEEEGLTMVESLKPKDRNSKRRAPADGRVNPALATKTVCRLGRAYGGIVFVFDRVKVA